MLSNSTILNITSNLINTINHSNSTDSENRSNLTAAYYVEVGLFAAALVALVGSVSFYFTKTQRGRATLTFFCSSCSNSQNETDLEMRPIN